MSAVPISLSLPRPLAVFLWAPLPFSLLSVFAETGLGSAPCTVGFVSQSSIMTVAMSTHPRTKAVCLMDTVLQQQGQRQAIARAGNSAATHVCLECRFISLGIAGSQSTELGWLQCSVSVIFPCPVFLIESVRSEASS